MLNSQYAPYSQTSRKSARELALEHFREAILQGWLKRPFAKLAGQSNALSQLRAQAAAGQQHHVGLRTVPIVQITGSENRSRDFDRAFHPLSDKTRDRWLSVMEARLRGVPLSPVELTKVGNTYFVRDGHHRISVANALGEGFIEAVVTERA
jgi:hypothetical protein